MRQKPTGRTSSSEQIIRDIKRKTRKQSQTGLRLGTKRLARAGVSFLTRLQSFLSD